MIWSWKSSFEAEEKDARDLLRGCWEGNPDKLSEFRDAYWNIVIGLIFRLIHQHRGDPVIERLKAAEIRHIAAICCGRLFSQWKEVEISRPNDDALILGETVRRFTLGVACRCLWGPPYPTGGAGGPTLGQAQVDKLANLYGSNWARAVLILAGHWKVPKDIAEDAVQHVFLNLVRHAREGRDIEILKAPEKEFLSYLLKGSMNSVKDQAASLERFLNEDISLLETLKDAVSVEASVEQHSLEEGLIKIVRGLDSPYREILDLILEKDMRLADIARRLDRSPGSIYTQFQRAVVIIREKFEGG